MCTRTEILVLLRTLLVTIVASSCAASSHPTGATGLGLPISSARMEALIDQPGPVEVETVVGADWEVPRAGLINLNHPAAKAAHLTDDNEPIQIFVHVLRHPTRGMFLIDTGVTKMLVEHPAQAGVGWLLRKVLHPEKMKLRNSTAALLAREPRPLGGVLLTHLHLDHVGGVADVPRGTPIYAGPGEITTRRFMNVFTQGTIDRLLEGQVDIEQLQPQPDPSGRFAGVTDLFGDGSVFAIWVPGHTPGSTAYLVRSPKGPVLFTGDACHTRWGWDHAVEPGKFSDDVPRGAESLGALRALVGRHPQIDVRLGHQR